MPPRPSSSHPRAAPLSVAVDLAAPFQLTGRVLPGVAERRRGGTVNVSSAAGLVGERGMMPIGRLAQPDEIAAVRRASWPARYSRSPAAGRPADGAPRRADRALMAHDGRASWTCRDARTIAAPIERCFATLADLATYPLWWTLVHVTRDDGGDTRLATGAHLRFDGARPGGTPVAWTAAVRAIEAPRRIVLSYDGGSLIGDTAWELDEIAGGTTVAYRYLGVRGNEEQSRATFARFGTKLHSLAMQHDALAGLERHLVAGAIADEAWRAHVNQTIAAALRPHRA